MRISPHLCFSLLPRPPKRRHTDPDSGGVKKKGHHHHGDPEGFTPGEDWYNRDRSIVLNESSCILRRGTQVRLRDLVKAVAHNGQTGSIDKYNEKSQRYTVQMMKDTTILSVKMANFTQMLRTVRFSSTFSRAWAVVNTAAMLTGVGVTLEYIYICIYIYIFFFAIACYC
jgi:hypothetical protein